MLTGCNESEEKTSDPKVLLSETENKLPVSTLPNADTSLEQSILRQAPELNEFSTLTATINNKDPNSYFAISKIEWTKNNTIISSQFGGGNIRYTTYKKGYGCGFFSCDGYNTIDNRMRIKSDLNNDSYYIYEISEYPRKYLKKYTEKDNEGQVVTKTKNKTRDRASLPKKDFRSTSYSMVFNNVPYGALRKFDLYESYCGDSGDYDYDICKIEIKYFDQEVKEQKAIHNFLLENKIELISIKAIEQLYNKYSKYDDIRDYLSQKALSRIKKKNSIVELHEFNKQYKSHQEATKESTGYLFDLIKTKDSVAGYEWFITHYSNSKYSKSALERIHEIMFGKAQKVDTIAAYNSFIFSYPTAKQVETANNVANEKERSIYTNLGALSFWDTDHKKEKKSRKFLIKAKQIERFPRDNDLRGNRKSGYLIVADRMYKLLQEEFDESDATLRHLESQEFKDFVSDFKDVMRNIRYTLEKIESNTDKMSRYSEEMVSVSRKGFSDAKTDRAMTAYHEKKKTEWDKFMHYRDKGYN